MVGSYMYCSTCTMYMYMMYYMYRYMYMYMYMYRVCVASTAVHVLVGLLPVGPYPPQALHCSSRILAIYV